MLADLEPVDDRDYHFADTNVRVRAPQRVLDVLDHMFAHVTRIWSGSQVPIAVEVALRDGSWHIRGGTPDAGKRLDETSPLPQVAGAVVSSILADLAAARNVSVWRAAIVEHDGKALALVGDDWESAITLAAHLHARNWRMLGGDYALVNVGSMIAIPFRKLLHVSSASVGFFPIAYRGAVEASPWYSSDDAIAFYAIDPTLVNGAGAWGTRTPIRAVLHVNGQTAPAPVLAPGEDFQITESLWLHDLPPDIEGATLTRGTFIETADLLERWFSALPAVS